MSLIKLPKCEQFKKEFIELCAAHELNYNITTDDTHIVIHIKIERDFDNREHLNAR